MTASADEGTTAEPTEPPQVRVREGALAKTARIVAIVRDLVIIGLVVAALAVGGKIAGAMREGVDPAGVTQTNAPCLEPTTDDYGTYCPDEAPGG